MSSFFANYQNSWKFNLKNIHDKQKMGWVITSLVEVKMIYKHNHLAWAAALSKLFPQSELRPYLAIEKGIIAVENRKLRVRPHDQEGFNQIYSF